MKSHSIPAEIELTVTDMHSDRVFVTLNYSGRSNNIGYVTRDSVSGAVAFMPTIIEEARRLL